MPILPWSCSLLFIKFASKYPFLRALKSWSKGPSLGHMRLHIVSRHLAYSDKVQQDKQCLQNIYCDKQQPDKQHPNIWHTENSNQPHEYGCLTNSNRTNSKPTDSICTYRGKTIRRSGHTAPTFTESGQTEPGK